MPIFGMTLMKELSYFPLLTSGPVLTTPTADSDTGPQTLGRLHLRFGCCCGGFVLCVFFLYLS